MSGFERRAASYPVELSNIHRRTSTGRTIVANSGNDHSLVDAFGEPAVLAAISLGLLDDAGAIANATVLLLVLNRSLEESFGVKNKRDEEKKKQPPDVSIVDTFTSFARRQAVVNTRCFIIADTALERHFSVIA